MKNNFFEEKRNSNNEWLKSIEVINNKIMRLKLDISFFEQKNKFFSECSAKYGIGVLPRSFNNTFGDFQQDENDHVWSMIDKDGKDFSFSSSKITSAISDIFKKIIEYIPSAYEITGFKRAATLDLNLRIMGHSLYFQNFDFTCSNVILLLQKCEAILTKLDQKQVSHSLTDCVQVLEKQFPLKLSHLCRLERNIKIEENISPLKKSGLHEVKTNSNCLIR